MVQISRKDKEKVLEAIRLGKIDTTELALPALADSIVLTMKQHGFIEPLNDAPINACVVHDTKEDNFFVFMTTDTTKNARQIIQTYELRPETEEDFRQMKDFWKLSDFKSTKYNYITLHIIMTLTGYLFFQIYKNLEEGQAYSDRSLPVAAKNYKETKPKEIVVYVGQYFGIFPFLEFLKIYAECTLEVRQLLDPVLAKV